MDAITFWFINSMIFWFVVLVLLYNETAYNVNKYSKVSKQVLELIDEIKETRKMYYDIRDQVEWIRK